MWCGERQEAGDSPGGHLSKLFDGSKPTHSFVNRIVKKRRKDEERWGNGKEESGSVSKILRVGGCALRKRERRAGSIPKIFIFQGSATSQAGCGGPDLRGFLEGSLKLSGLAWVNLSNGGINFRGAQTKEKGGARAPASPRTGTRGRNQGRHFRNF